MPAWTRRQLLYAVTAVAIVSTTAGFSLASTLSSSTVSQTASLYSVSTSGVAGFPTTPAVAVGSLPPGVSACTSSAVALASGGSAALYLPASAAVTCATGDFAIVLNFTSAANAGAGTYSFTSFDAFGTGPTTGAATANVSVASTLSSAGLVSVYIDFGTTTPPAGGISSLSVVVG